MICRFRKETVRIVKHFSFVYTLICDPRDETDCCLMLTREKFIKMKKVLPMNHIVIGMCSLPLLPPDIFRIFSKYRYSSNTRGLK